MLSNMCKLEDFSWEKVLADVTILGFGISPSIIRVRALESM